MTLGGGGGPSLQMPHHPGPMRDESRADRHLALGTASTRCIVGVPWLEASAPVPLTRAASGQYPGSLQSARGSLLACLPWTCQLPGAEGPSDGMRTSDKDLFIKKAQTPKSNAVDGQQWQPLVSEVQ